MNLFQLYSCHANQYNSYESHIIVDIYVTFMKCMHAFGVMLPPASGCQYKIVRIKIKLGPEEKIITISFVSVFKYFLFFIIFMQHLCLINFI